MSPAQRHFLALYVAFACFLALSGFAAKKPGDFHLMRVDGGTTQWFIGTPRSKCKVWQHCEEWGWRSENFGMFIRRFI